MVRLTPELLARAPERINPFGDRELSLRGLGIPVIENTGAANDQFQCLDLSDNDISVLGGFSLMKRLRTLLMHNNPISSISVNVGRTLPFLQHLVMSDGKLDLLAEFDRLSGLKHLETLVLTGNPITAKPQYRLYCIYKIPSLQVLDFQRVRLKERREAKRKFESAVGQKVEEVIRSTAVQAQQDDHEKTTALLPTDALEKRRAIEKAIREAKTMEEVERLQAMLDLGIVPASSSSSQQDKQSSSADTAGKKLDGTTMKEVNKKQQEPESSTKDDHRKKNVDETSEVNQKQEPTEAKKQAEIDKKPVEESRMNETKAQSDKEEKKEPVEDDKQVSTEVRMKEDDKGTTSQVKDQEDTNKKASTARKRTASTVSVAETKMDVAKQETSVQEEPKKRPTRGRKAAAVAEEPVVAADAQVPTPTKKRASSTTTAVVEVVAEPAPAAEGPATRKRTKKS